MNLGVIDMINYFSEDNRETPINSAAARILLCTWTIWVLVMYEWTVYPHWPSPLYDLMPVLRHPAIISHIGWIVAICGCLVLSVLIGYRVSFAAWGAAVLLTYLGVVRTAYQISHTSKILMTVAILFVIIAVFDQEDKITIDQIRRTRHRELTSLTSHLETDIGQHRHRALKWGLVVFGFFYFHSGIKKLINSPIEWLQPASLGRYILFRLNGDGTRFLGEFMLEHPILLFIGALATILLQIGFLMAILLGTRVWPFFLIIVGMHTTIMFSVGPIFIDHLILLSIFVPWDTILQKAQPTENTVIVYDKHCFFCARSLHVFRFLDVSGNTSYYNQNNVPSEYESDEFHFEDAMYAFQDNSPQEGYYAFKCLFEQVGLYPVSIMMSLPGVSHIGEHIYRYIADNRSRYFVCSVR
jgi:predicted DCC family thiol-disulfide oxidoreductase YuxK